MSQMGFLTSPWLISKATGRQLEPTIWDQLRFDNLDFAIFILQKRDCFRRRPLGTTTLTTMVNHTETAALAETEGNSTRRDTHGTDNRAWGRAKETPIATSPSDTPRQAATSGCLSKSWTTTSMCSSTSDDFCAIPWAPGRRAPDGSPTFVTGALGVTIFGVGLFATSEVPGPVLRSLDDGTWRMSKARAAVL
mmetsp:Transcript_11461/g.25318  ORF Transcript_11461/g.25318 Transcript_11461/m.25318 type:complete len:193 (+) Transcript_11461:744-1322(+)